MTMTASRAPALPVVRTGCKNHDCPEERSPAEYNPAAVFPVQYGGAKARTVSRKDEPSSLSKNPYPTPKVRKSNLERISKGYFPGEAFHHEQRGRH
jgi:hypothetical protein